MNTYDIKITQSTSFLVYLTCQESDGSYINLSGYSARGKVKHEYGCSNYLYDLNPQPIAPFESGIVMVSGSATSTSGLACGSFLYDIEIYQSDFALKVLDGDFIVYPSTSFN